MKTNTRKLTVLAVLSAIAFVIMVVGRVQIMPIPPYLKYDPKDVILTIGGFLYGPLAAFMITAVVSFVEMITVSETGLIGLLMNIVAGCSFACTAAFIYKKKSSIGGAAAGLVTACIFATAVMMMWNYIITPIYTGIPRQAIASLLIPAFLPFNLIKNGLNAAFTFLLYRPVRAALEATGTVSALEQTESRRQNNIGAVAAAFFVILTCVLWVLTWQGKL